jgi:hypothetical protein
LLLYEIWGSHGGDYYLLGCDAVVTPRCKSTRCHNPEAPHRNPFLCVHKRNIDRVSGDLTTRSELYVLICISRLQMRK